MKREKAEGDNISDFFVSLQMQVKHLRHIIVMLLAAAGLYLFAASSVSCSKGKAEAYPEDALSRHNSPRPLPPDTLALVEGLRLFEDGDYEGARGQLTVSARSASTWIRAESFLYLNALEMELGNYAAARTHLDRYHSETMRMLRSTADSSSRMERQAAQLRRRHDTLVGGMVVLTIMVAGAVVFISRGRRAKIIAPLHDPDRHAYGDTGWNRVTMDEGISTRRNNDGDTFQAWMDDAETFRQTPIWAEVASLAEQRPGREAKVITSARQDVLDAELAHVFADFAATLRRDYPTLTAGDVKLCCLSLLPLPPFGRALCWGSTETNIIKQRKHVIKKKLAGDVRGRGLFEFIFAAR